MAKTQEELNQLKIEYEALNNKLKELTDEELKEVSGGSFFDILNKIGKGIEQKVKPILSSSDVVSPEEILGGKIPNFNNK